MDVHTNKTMRHRLAVFWFQLTFSGQIWSWLLVLWCLRNAYTGALMVMYLAYIWGPGWRAAETAGNPAPLKKWRLWNLFRDYFSAKLIKTADLDPKKNYIFSLVPHGICSYSAWINFATDASGFSEQYPGIDVHCVTLDGNFRAPLIREYCLAHGLRSASRKAITNILTAGPGRSVLLVPGGAAESLLSAPGTYDTLVGKRYGFVRVAMAAGASLVPALAFGETDTYDTYIPPDGSVVQKLQQVAKKLFGCATPIIFGVGVTGGSGLMPKSVPLTTVVGAPIDIPKYEGPANSTDTLYNQLVEQYHEQYLQALQKLWQQYKNRYAPKAKRELNIIRDK